MTNWDEFKCRASAVSKMMASKQGERPISETGLKKIKEYEDKMKIKPLAPGQQIEYTALILKRDTPPKQEFGDTCLQYLMEVYAWETERMISVGKESLETLAMSKGKKQEGVAKELLELVDGRIYNTNKERISNDFFTGEIDLFLGESIYEATNITDLKNAEDYIKFLRKTQNGLESGQREQVATYCDITGAAEGFIAHTCVDFSLTDMLDMQMKLVRKLGCISTESPEFLAEWPKWEHSMIVSGIPPRKRVHKIPVELFTEAEKQIIYDRVKGCREFLWKFDEERQKLN